MSELSIHSDEHYMKEALKQAQMAFEDGEVPVGAVIVSNNIIIARAHNQTERLKDATAHAEMLAITAAESYLGAKYLNECKMYVTLEPCVMCAGASYWSQLGEIVYGASDEKRGYSVINKSITHPKTVVRTGILADQCGKVMSDFFGRLREK
jgi:tRNA(adenine34) deaminase